MTVTETPPRPTRAATDWVDDLGASSTNWDPDLTVGDWWERMGMAGWSAPCLPVDAYGRGLTRPDAMLAARIIA